MNKFKIGLVMCISGIILYGITSCFISFLNPSWMIWILIIAVIVFLFGGAVLWIDENELIEGGKE